MKIEEKEIKVVWDANDECFVATMDQSDLIGCGDTQEEAILHLKNHLLDEQETPRKRKAGVTR